MSDASDKTDMRFYLGTHLVRWLQLTDVPLFVSNRQLSKRASLSRAKGRWALDSGGFSELSMFGKWHTSPQEYAHLTKRYAEHIGGMDWASIQDWMCEPSVLAKTHKSVIEHQHLTIQSYLDLKNLAPEINYIPVIQGWSIDDYERCVDLYASYDIDLTQFETVGIGSVCRRQNTSDIAHIIYSIASKRIRLHGFGVKKQGLQRIAPYLVSSDSMAWSFTARRGAPLKGCKHSNCANCFDFAVQWFEQIQATINERLLFA